VHPFELLHDLKSADVTEEVLRRGAAVLIIVVLALLARWLLGKVIDRLVRRAESGLLPDRIQWLGSDNAAARRVQRARTMGSVLKSLSSIVVFAIGILMVLPELGLNIGPLLASAGIIGVALGFGAQSLVKDFLSGIFMIFEDQYGVGDVVDVGEASGTVEAVTLRVTRLRDVNGTVWYVRNGEILRVGNMSQNWARTVLDVPVSYREDLARVRQVLQEVAHDLWEDEDFKGQVIEEPEVWGVESMTPEAVTVRVTMKTAPLQQWNVAREMRERVKARFDHEGITMPHPQRLFVDPQAT
jgi:small-conductance mechanosensitive channel